MDQKPVVNTVMRDWIVLLQVLKVKRCQDISRNTADADAAIQPTASFHGQMCVSVRV